MTAVTNRPYVGDDDDFIAIRRFLVETFTAFGWMYNWGVERWDIQRHIATDPADLAGERLMDQFTQIWETEGRIVGVAHPEDGGDIWIEIDPDFRHLEDAMFAWAEEHRSPSRRPDQPFSAYVVVGDSVREQVLEHRGWTRGDLAAHLRRRSMAEPLPVGPVADGYVVRSLNLVTTEDSEGRAAVSRASFGHERTGEMTKLLAQAPSYRPDLDLAAVAEDGTFAAYTTVWWEPVNKYVIFEPVGTHPEHRRKGLASAVIAEGLRRSAALGAEMAHVGSGAGQPSNVLYDSLGFRDVVDYARWDAPGSKS